MIIYAVRGESFEVKAIHSVLPSHYLLFAWTRPSSSFLFSLHISMNSFNFLSAANNHI